ncbi:MAG: Stp1/IreP family PP2C-type Ser/Thr phosphatase [Actinomycetota bacterium]|nr:Stp1/IreP family PP2C-type Ser/Thr phosphatase [Actinomycetota bacterium]
MRFSVATDPGRRRRHNEDAYVCEPPLFAIADGMGGAQAGEVASGLAAAVLAEAGGEVLGEDRVASLIQEANRRVFQRSNEDTAASGMGTTMTVALIDASDATIAIGHVGDSRAYRVRDGSLEQLTDDHSLVGELVRSGKLSPVEAETHPQRSVITRAVGTEPEVDVDTFTVQAEPNDLFLLCSDGLTDMIPDREIQALLDGTDDLDRISRALVDAANAGGGEDNITVVLFTVEPAAEPDPGETARMPAVPDPEQAEDDEDTLSGLERIPAVDTAVVSAAEMQERLRQAEATGEPNAEPRRRILPFVFLVLLLVAIVLLAAWGLTR